MSKINTFIPCRLSYIIKCELFYMNLSILLDRLSMKIAQVENLDILILLYVLAIHLRNTKSKVWWLNFISINYNARFIKSSCTIHLFDIVAFMSKVNRFTIR